MVFGSDGNIGTKMPSATLFYMARVDLGPQPRFGCASRLWREIADLIRFHLLNVFSFEL
jgi:hypothetical protein